VPQPTPAPLAGSCSLLASDPPNDDESAIRALLVAEGELVVAQNIDAAMQLWSDDARVVDAKNAPADPVDDPVWDGKEAIRNRYARIVFRAAPTLVDQGGGVITLRGGRAQVESSTTIRSEVAPAGDRWELVNGNGSWLLATLTYNLE